MPTTARVVDLSSGFEGSPVKSLSRNVRKSWLFFFSPCFVDFASNPSAPPKKKQLLSTKSCFFFIHAAGLVWNQRAPRVVWNCDEVAHGIARSAYRINLLRLDAIHGVAAIPFRPLVRFHTAINCGFHTRLTP